MLGFLPAPTPTRICQILLEKYFNSAHGNTSFNNNSKIFLCLNVTITSFKHLASCDEFRLFCLSLGNLASIFCVALIGLSLCSLTTGAGSMCQLFCC